MSRNRNIVEAVAAFMIAVMLMPVSGCSVYKPIKVSELPGKGNYKYVLHIGDTKSQLMYPLMENGTLSGYLKEGKPEYGNKVHFYLSSDYEVIKDSLGMVRIPLDSISEIKRSKISYGLTIIAGLGIFTGAVIIVFLVTLIAGGGYDM